MTISPHIMATQMKVQSGSAKGQKKGIKLFEGRDHSDGRGDRIRSPYVLFINSSIFLRKSYLRWKPILSLFYKSGEFATGV